MKKRTKRIVTIAVLIVLLVIGWWYLFLGSRIADSSSEVIHGEEGTRSLVVYFSRSGEIPDTVDAVASATPNSNQAMEGSDTEAAAKIIQELTGADLYQIRTERHFRSAFWGTAATAWIDVSMDYIREVSEGATVLEGYRVHNSTLEDVAEWLARIGMLEQADKPETADDGQAGDEMGTRVEGQEESMLGYVTEGTEEYRGFVIDNVFHSVTEGDIHYNVYIPESYNGSEPYALYFTLPGYEGLYFQGAATNLQSEEFGFEAQKYNEKMIIVAPQLSDWGENSANQTIALVEYFLEAYNIDRSRVYGNGFSGGGETMSQVMGKRPDLFTAYLQVSSQWDGEYEPVVEQRLPVYFAIGQGDEYYGSGPSQKAYDTLYDLYVQQGLSEAEINELLVLDVKEHDYFTDRGISNEHGGGGLFAYDEEIMGWLFSH